MSIISDYRLKDFGRTEYRDPVVPVQILLILMGFTVALLNNVTSEAASDPLYFWATVCGVVYLLSYMFYLTEYYDQIWQHFYLLPEDKLYCRVYSIGIALVVLSLMPHWPQYWPLYVTVMFLFLYRKKIKTRNAYRKAVALEYGRTDWCYEPITRARLELAEVFTRNFLTWGVGFFIPFATILVASAVMWDLSLSVAITETIVISPDVAKWVYICGSFFITALTAYFWKEKVTRGLIEMRRKAEAGDHEFFKNM